MTDRSQAFPSDRREKGTKATPGIGHRCDFDHALAVELAAQRYSKRGLEPVSLGVAREVPYTLFVNDREVLSMATLPTHLRELFIGFLVSEGVLVRLNELIGCWVDPESKLVRVELDVPDERIEKLETRGMLTSGCAGGMVFSLEASAIVRTGDAEPLRVSCSSILGRMREVDTFPGIYRVTRGVHAAAVAEEFRSLVILEDLGRHNAVDKIVGYCFLNQVQTRDKLLITTGRITSEVLTKAARSEFPVIVSRSSASALALQIARQCSIDVVSYVRGGRFNYFSHGGITLVDE